MLKFVVKMGKKASKVHRIIKFKQDYFIRDYIELDTKMRIGGYDWSWKGYFQINE